ncbi:hypothetical protein AGMMS49525_08680 [Bacteroidia bacterium]|nr:hypothetical protein AGMMS49525_08680 [Bacteroidia bacterium]
MSTKKIIRTYSAGVWYGEIKSLNGSIAVIKNARRLWCWSGAASLSQMAIDGVKNPSGCKFAMTITDDEGVYLPQVIEILPVTPKAQEIIESVPDWKV